ncbi:MULTISPECIES: hypothetical protein [Lysinibacillus]|nr:MULTISPECIES: hypothetical protein [Lysinibacillus]UUV27075.1 hypothetical protein NP781_11145 [Lysinibacillus sp. FN11]UYB45336.1 hypothetical protein OCI51_13800 [Lysinibacillus capsici]
MSLFVASTFAMIALIIALLNDMKIKKLEKRIKELEKSKSN